MKRLKAVQPLYLFLYQFFLLIGMVLVRLLYPVRTVGRENIALATRCAEAQPSEAAPPYVSSTVGKAPSRGKTPGQGFVLCPNHLSAIDPLFVVLARGFGKKMLIMGKEELFRINPLLNFFWCIAGAFPVHRGKGDTAAIEEAVEEVRAGRGLLIFPEGTRSKDGNLGRLKSGAFVVAMEANACLVPCHITYAAGRPKAFRRITVTFGPPASLSELGLAGLAGQRVPAALREAKHRFADQMQALYPQEIALP